MNVSAEKIKAVLMTIQTLLIGLISIFTAKTFISFVTRINKSLPCDWPTAYSTLILRFFMEIGVGQLVLGDTKWVMLTVSKENAKHGKTQQILGRTAS